MGTWGSGGRTACAEHLAQDRFSDSASMVGFGAGAQKSHHCGAAQPSLGLSGYICVMGMKGNLEIRHVKGPTRPWYVLGSLLVTLPFLNISSLATRGDSGCFSNSALLAARREPKSWSWLTAQLTWEGTAPTRACMRLWPGSVCSPHASQGSEPEGLSLCFLPTCFLLPSPQPSVPTACPSSPGGRSPNSHKGWRPANDPFLASPPRVPRGQRDYRPHPELAVTHPLSQGCGMSSWKGPRSAACPASGCTDRRQSHEPLTTFPSNLVPVPVPRATGNTQGQWAPLLSPCK